MSTFRIAWSCMLLGLLPISSSAIDLLPPSADYSGARFLDAAFDTVSIIVLDGDKDGRFTGYKLPFLRKGFKIEEDADVPLGGGALIQKWPRLQDKYLIEEDKSKKKHDKEAVSRYYRRVKKIETLGDLKGYVRIRSAYEALEYLRFTTSQLTKFQFPTHAMMEVYCAATYSDTDPQFEDRPVGSMEECAHYGFSPPEGRFDLEIAKVETKIKGKLTMQGIDALRRLEESLKRTTTEKKKVEIESEREDTRVRVKTRGQELTDEESSLLTILVDIVKTASKPVEIEIEAEVDENRIPSYFLISRTVFSGRDDAFAQVTEQVGRDGSWWVVNKRIITPGTLELAKKFIARSRPRR